MQGTLHDLDGDAVETIELPPVFETPYRPDLIRRAVIAAQANRKQEYGADPFAGMRTPAESPGSGRGMAHVPRINGSGPARRVPHAVAGRRAHPPTAEADPTKDINDKERQLAIRSAIAATAQSELVAERGHQFDAELPAIVADDFASLEKTREAVEVLEALDLHADIERADETKIRAGRGTTRGRKYRRPASILFVTTETPSRAARNLAGATVATAREVDAEALAPGGEPGRLTVWTAAAIEEVADR